MIWYKIHTTDKVVNDIIEQLLELNFEITAIDAFYIYIKIEKYYYIRLWNENKYYSWLSHGLITKIDNKETKYKWDYKMPSLRNLRKFRKLIKIKLKEHPELTEIKFITL